MFQPLCSKDDLDDETSVFVSVYLASPISGFKLSGVRGLAAQPIKVAS